MHKVKTVNICMAIRTLSETDNSGNNSEVLLLIVMVLVRMNASVLKQSFAKSRWHVGKLAPSRKYTWVIALLRGGELDAPKTGFQLCSYSYLMESVSVKPRPLKLGNVLCLSDTVPGGVICAFATTYKPAVVEVCTMHTSEPFLGTQVITMVRAMVANNYIKTQYTIQLLLY